MLTKSTNHLILGTPQLWDLTVTVGWAVERMILWGNVSITRAQVKAAAVETVIANYRYGPSIRKVHALQAQSSVTRTISLPYGAQGPGSPTAGQP